MRRIMTGVVAFALLSACGSSNESSSSTTASTVSSEESQDEADGADGQTASDEEPTQADDGSDQTQDEGVDDGGSDDTGDTADGSAGDEASSDDDRIVIDEFSDMPSECMDLFRSFLQDIEPIVSTIDWQAATLAEFEELGTQFDEVSRDFEDEATQNGCDRFDLDGEASFDAMIEFAEQEAPGTVGFFEFLAEIQQMAVDLAPGDDEPSAAPADCAEATGQIESLMNEYGQMSNVPASELMQISQLAANLTTVCTIAELEAFMSRTDIEAFFGS